MHEVIRENPVKFRRFNRTDMRETGWSPIYCRRRFLRKVAPSKQLLLCIEMCIENVAHNGGVAHGVLV